MNGAGLKATASRRSINGLRHVDQQLQTLERWRALELEEARMDYVRRAAAVRLVREALDELERAIEGTRQFARERLSERGPRNVAELRWLREYAAWQAGEQAAHAKKLQELEARAEEARLVVLQLFEKLSSVQRLRERGRQARAVDEQRREQKQIDELALRRLAWRSMQSVS